jgi:hypothetical protein
MLGRDQRAERGTTADVAGAYNDTFTPRKKTGRRTSRIVNPANGRLPPMTPKAGEGRSERSRVPPCAAASDRDLQEQGDALRRRQIRFQALAALCRCAAALQHGDDQSVQRPGRCLPRVRCLMGGLPEAGTLGAIADRISFRRIVQTPGGITMFYDVGQGQGWQRNIIMNGSPHLPANIRQWYGDSRGHWEGSTLVIDVTNFSSKTDFQGSRENLHLVERWTRTGPTTLDYEVRVEDPTVWTQAWIAKQEFTLQSNEENRIYPEPRCHEGNYGLPVCSMAIGRKTRRSQRGKAPIPGPSRRSPRTIASPTRCSRARHETEAA